MLGAKVVTADARLAVLYRLGKSVRDGANWRAQWSRPSLAPQDRSGIGGRFTVRRFDGEVSLTGKECPALAHPGGADEQSSLLP